MAQRPDLPPASLANLMFRAVQSQLLFTKDGYPHGYETKRKWKEYIMKLTDDVSFYSELLATLERNTTTTKYQRYLPPLSLITTLCPYKDVSVADLGCGGDLGFPGIIIRESFAEFTDNTGGFVTDATRFEKLGRIQLYAVDKEHPLSDVAISWRFACSYYPSEIIDGEDRREKEFEARIRVGKVGQRFIQADITEPSFPALFGDKRVDFVTILTTLYQLPDSLKVKAISNAKKLLEDDGTIIVQDFFSKDPKNPSGFDTNINWSGPNSYNTFVLSSHTRWMPLHVLGWNGGRCTEVWKGEDFDEFISKFVS